MADRLSFQSTFQALEKAIGLSQHRHQLITSDLSNLNTPGHRGRDIDFRSTMERVLNQESSPRMVRTDPKHIGGGNGISEQADAIENDGEWNGINWVNVDETMVKLSENSLVYRTATEALLRKIALMKEVIRESGR